MSKQNHIVKIILYIVFAVYIIFLLKLLFFSRVSLTELFVHRDDRSVNLVPFRSIWLYLSGNPSSFSFSNVFGNMIAFFPLGLFLPLLQKNKKLLPNFAVIFATSLLTELLQYAFVIGAADIDDLILNSLGGLLGILCCKLLGRLIKDEDKLRLILAIPSVIIGLPILLYLLFFIKLRL